MPTPRKRRRGRGASVVGQVLPARYRLNGELARGGMGIVYRAIDRKNGRAVAVKTLISHPREDLLAFLRFNREARTVSSLRHPNICEVFEVSTFRGQPFIVMELLEGETVRTRLARGGCDTKLGLSIARQVAAGLAAAHDRFIIHRDIKPANVFITSAGIVKLLDFGLAKHFAAVDTSTALTVTETGYTPGTVHYMAPEQLLGQRVDQRTDLFSLGVLLYELITGRKPFPGATSAETIAAILHEAPPPLPAMPYVVEWNFVLERLLAKDADQRYATADALLNDLSLFESVARGETTAWPRRAPVEQTASPKSLAIVPFGALHERAETAEQKSDVEYFCYTLVDAITVGLSQIDGLRVVPRTLSSRVTRGGRALPRVARLLHTDHLLTGTVERHDESLAAAISLFDVKANTVVWTKPYEVGVEELFQLRDRIVRDVAAELDLATAILPRKRRPAAPNRQAFQLCLKGRFFWSRRYEDGLLKGLECFREAIKLDATLALAHAGLADTFSFLGFYSLMRPRTAFTNAATHAREALRLDPSLAEAHTSLGLVKLGGDWDWDGAMSEFSSAITLDPTQALARIYLSWTHVLRNEITEAHQQAERAQDIDPLSPILNAGTAYTFFLSRSYERAIRECEKALEIDNDFLVARYVMALCKGQLGLRAEAIRDLEFAVKLSGGMIFYLTLLGKMYADTGEPPLVDKAKQILLTFDELRAAGRYVGPHAYVYVYAGLGDLDSAFDWQAKAFDDGASPFNYLSPQLSVLHGDPRFFRDLSRWNIELTPSGVVKRAVGGQSGADGQVQPE